MIPRARPVDIPADLAAWIEIGGPWSVRLIYGDRATCFEKKRREI